MAVSSAVKISIVGIVGAVLVAVGAVLCVVFPNIIKDKISQNLRIVNGTDLYKSWEEAPIPIYMQFYFFNVTNPDEILANSSIKPVLQELGPYTYREYRKKVNISFDEENGTVTYEQIKWFIHRPELTKGSLEDIVTTINLPLLGLGFKTAGQLSVFHRMIFNNMLRKFRSSIFVTKSVDELLFRGYQDELMIAVAEKAKREILPNGTFGFFYRQNYTADGVYSVYTGTTENSTYPNIAAWNHSSSVTYWNDTYCDMVNGTDGSSFSPFLTRNDLVRIFSPELCRSLYMAYDEDTTVHGINTYRYATPFSLLADSSINPDNECFCPGGENCLLSGLLNVSVCKQGAPIVMSPVHFYQSDPVYVNAVVGLNPKKEEHDTVLDVEPTTGAVLRAARRLQVNAALKPLPHLTILKNLPDMIFPVLWVNESADLGADKAEIFKAKIIQPMIIGKAVTYALIAIGAFILVIAFIICIRIATQKKKSTMNNAPLKIPLNEKPINYLPVNYEKNSHYPNNDEANHALLNKFPT